MAVVDFNAVNAMAIAIVNADSLARFMPATVNKAAISTGAIQRAVLLSDSQVLLADIDNPYHYRDLVPSADLAHGDSVPGGVMRPCSVVIKIAAADSVYVGGIRWRGGVDQIERWRRNHNGLYGPYAHDAANSPLGGKFTFKGPKIYFTGSAARIMRAPDLVIDYNNPVCQSDEAYSVLVLSGAIFLLYQEGMVSDALFMQHKAIWTEGIGALKARALALLQNTEE